MTCICISKLEDAKKDSAVSFYWTKEYDLDKEVFIKRFYLCGSAALCITASNNLIKEYPS